MSKHGRDDFQEGEASSSGSSKSRRTAIQDNSPPRGSPKGGSFDERLKEALEKVSIKHAAKLGRDPEVAALNPRPLTFGIEIELFIAFLPLGSEEEDPEPYRTAPVKYEDIVQPFWDITGNLHDEYNIYKAVARSLRAAGLDATIEEPDWESEFNEPDVESGKSLAGDETREDEKQANEKDKANAERCAALEPYQCWIIKHDCTISNNNEVRAQESAKKARVKYAEFRARHPGFADMQDAFEQQRFREEFATQEPYQFVCFEISSPAFYYTDSSFEEIKKMLEVLNTNFRSNVNTSCGLHVHVGDGFHNLPLETVKKLMALLWVWDDAFLSLHPKHRHTNQYSMGLRIPSSSINEGTVAADLFNDLKTEAASRGETITSARIIEQIRTCRSIRDLVDLFSKPPPVYGDTYDLSEHLAGQQFYVAYRLSNLFDRFNSTHTSGEEEATTTTTTAAATEAIPAASERTLKRTIEFRQHEATLEYPRVEAWCRTLVGVLAFVQDSDNDWFWEWVLRQMERIEGRVTGAEAWGSILDLLGLLGLEDQRLFYSRWLRDVEGDSDFA